MDFAARAARAGFAHLPEVVFLAAQVNVRFRHADGAPVASCLVVARNLVFRVALEHRDVQARFVHLPDVGEQFPGPGDGFLLEVIAKAPVAEHLEEGVVVGVLADVVQIVVLAAGADALLRVGGTLVGPGAGAEEHVLELVHAGVGEQQRRIVVRHHRRRRHKRVAVLLHEKVDELLANLRRAGHQ